MAETQGHCRNCKETFSISEWEQAHLRKFDAPLPSLCPDHRHQRRLAHRNERKIYRRTCDFSGKPVISMYSPEKKFKVYSPEIWWSDEWDARDYGHAYDFNRPFFDQFNDLAKEVPRVSLMNKNGENSEYCNVTTDNKNCYLVFGGDYNEDCLYSLFSMQCRDVSDVYWVTKSELVYDSVDCLNCYKIRYCQNSISCSESDFLFECKNCKNCVGCVGLNGKEFYIFNKPYSQEDFFRKIKTLELHTWSGVQKMKVEFEKFKFQFPHRHSHILNSENCTGDFIENARNCENCFNIEGPAEDLKDVFLAVFPIKDTLSSDHVGHKAEEYYEMLASVDGYHCAFCKFSWASQDTFYCDMVNSSHHLFGCISLRRNEYCILNKQYSKEEYFELFPRIVNHMKSTGEWGEFFPMNSSVFAYNETVAQDYFPLTKEESLARGLKWQDEEIRELESNEIPDSINEASDAILEKSFVCEKTGRPYKMIPSELKLYRKMEIPIPHFAPETRNEIRLKLRNPIKTWVRVCAKCGQAVQSTYAPEKKEIIYCEKCYLAATY